MCRSLLLICASACFVFTLGGCDSDSLSRPAIELRGAGSTFPAPLYERWFDDMTAQNPELVIDYDKVGSGDGVVQFIDELVDFAASDDPLTEQEIQDVDRGVQQIPMTSGAIVFAFNLTDSKGEPVGSLRLSRKAYSGIFLGEIRSWTDDEIARHNPEIDFPDLPIQVEYRLDSSGTTAALTRHLAQVSPEWRDGPGIGKTVTWPVGSGMPKSAGIVRGLRQVPGSIGYLSYAYALKEDLPIATLENQSGEFVTANLDSIQKGLAASNWTRNNTNTLRSDTEGTEAYPIVTYTWLLCYRVYQDPEKLDNLKALISYGLQEGQEYSAEMGYVALMDSVSQEALSALDSMSLPVSADNATSIPVADSPADTIASVVEEVVSQVVESEADVEPEAVVQSEELVEASTAVSAMRDGLEASSDEGQPEPALLSRESEDSESEDSESEDSESEDSESEDSESEDGESEDGESEDGESEDGER